MKAIFKVAGLVWLVGAATEAISTLIWKLKNRTVRS